MAKQAAVRRETPTSADQVMNLKSAINSGRYHVNIALALIELLEERLSDATVCKMLNEYFGSGEDTDYCVLLSIEEQLKQAKEELREQ